MPPECRLLWESLPRSERRLDVAASKRVRIAAVADLHCTRSSRGAFGAMLEQALARLSTPVRVAVLHYAPIQATVEGEPPPIFPFLGSSRLEEPLNRYGVQAVFHGHAHHGSPEGRTSAGIPVYNVSVGILR